MATQERDYMLRVRMTQDERHMLEGLAERAGLTASDIVRQLIRREHTVTANAEPVPKKKPKR